MSILLAPLWMGIMAAAEVASGPTAICPSTAVIPQLTIAELEEPSVPVIDKWQILLGNVPLSDAQLALMAKDDTMIDLTHEEMRDRGPWTYAAMGTITLGAFTSATGWTLLGQGKTSRVTSGGLAAGGMIAALGGLIWLADRIQRPIQPHTAPTPVHRLTRAQARALVTSVNQTLYEQVCRAGEKSRGETTSP